MVVFTTEDGQQHEADYEIIAQFGLFKDVERSQFMKPLPIPDVSSAAFKKILQYCGRHSGDHDREINPILYMFEAVDPWDLQFFGRIDHALLFEIISAAKSLRIPRLYHLGYKLVANDIKGKSMEEVRAIFGLDNVGA
ncbi:E3 ubiquitin ligase complex SCF subunit sconC [Grifola frondosa]|uniref:E3 ubiquitin ligase complex SCF subunit n=1 Tax=Grifola frondosa TaxID=5627 RepID=A0A1C7LXN9_GRIFR|nr:E3 ubiquitin ligase complex SCF subunit sconC [Grifola frondosa]